MPATRQIVDKLLTRQLPALKSMVMCFEDAIRAVDVEAAEANAHKQLGRMSRGLDDCHLGENEAQLSFRRVCGRLQVERFESHLCWEEARSLSCSSTSNTGEPAVSSRRLVVTTSRSPTTPGGSAPSSDTESPVSALGGGRLTGRGQGQTGQPEREGQLPVGRLSHSKAPKTAAAQSVAAARHAQAPNSTGPSGLIRVAADPDRESEHEVPTDARLPWRARRVSSSGGLS
jgi:hypothetical protein